MLSPVFVFKNAKHTEKIKNNTVKNLSAFHLDSEIVHVLPHLFYFFIVFFFFLLAQPFEGKLQTVLHFTPKNQFVS